MGFLAQCTNSFISALSPSFDVKRQCSVVSKKDFAASPSDGSWLGEEPFTTILVPGILESLPASGAAALRTVCKGIHHASNTRQGMPLFPNVSTKALSLEEGKISEAGVRSMLLPTASDPSIEEFDAQRFRNCRTVQWVPESDAKRGEFVESHEFAVQGLSGLKFRFYPAGKPHARQGFCSLYVACKTTDRDVALRLKVGNQSHILKQRMNGDYVDGFVNFCSFADGLVDGKFTIELTVNIGAFDDEKERMKVQYTPKWASWTIPNMTDLSQFSVGDRLTSDVFSVGGLGEDACFVLYPKGDMVDSISNVGDFVNVGLFGGSDRDVTFRLTSGKVSKILTACADRYSSKVFGTTKSCGEFFDACFGSLADMIDEDGSLRVTLDILDSQARHEMAASKGAISWSMDDAEHLVQRVRDAGEGDFNESRYFAMKSVSNGFFSLGFRSPAPGEVEVAIRKIHTDVSINYSCHKVLLEVSANDKVVKRPVRAHFNGPTGHVVTRFSVAEWKDLKNVMIKIFPVA